MKLSYIILIFLFTGYISPLWSMNDIDHLEIENSWWVINPDDLSDFQRPLEISELVKFEGGVMYSFDIGYEGDTINYSWISENSILLTNQYEIYFELKSRNFLFINWGGRNVTYFRVDHLKSIPNSHYEPLLLEITSGYWVEDIAEFHQRNFFYRDLKYPQDEDKDWRVMVSLKLSYDPEIAEVNVQSITRSWALKAVDGIVFLRFSESTNTDIDIPSSLDLLKSLRENRILILKNLEEGKMTLVGIDKNGEETSYLLNRLY